MRKLIFGLILIAALAGGYYYWWSQVSIRMVAEAVKWEEARKKEGYDISHTPFEVSGFPYRVKLTTQNLSIINPEHERKPKLLIEDFWLVIQPWNITQFILGTSKPVTASWNHKNALRHVTATPETLLGSGVFNLDGSLENMALDLVNTKYKFSWRPSLDIARSQFHTRPVSDSDEPAIEVAVQIENVTLDDGGNPYLGDKIETIDIIGVLRGNIKSRDVKGSLESWRDEGGVVDFSKIDIKWGAADFIGDGTITLDRKMRPLGAFSTKISGYKEIMQALAKSGQIPVQLAQTAVFGLNLLAKTDEQGVKSISLPVTAQDGGLYLGPVKLMPLEPIFIK